MDYLKKIDKIISFVIESAKFSGKEKKKLIKDLQSKYIHDCLIEIDKLLPKTSALKQKTKKPKNEKAIKEIFDMISDELGEEQLAEIFILQAENLLKDISKIVVEINNPHFLKQYNLLIESVFSPGK